MSYVNYIILDALCSLEVSAIAILAKFASHLYWLAGCLFDGLPRVTGQQSY